MKTVMIALIVISTLSQAAHAEDTVPSELVIGYDNEGKVDTSLQACLAEVKGVTEWDKAATERGQSRFVPRASVTQMRTLSCRATTRHLSKHSRKIAG
jgi:hypothetical protein